MADIYDMCSQILFTIRKQKRIKFQLHILRTGYKYSMYYFMPIYVVLMICFEEISKIN